MSAPLSALRRLREPVPGGRAEDAAGERCELCGAPARAGHGHVVDLETRSLLCTCDACRLLFGHGSTGHGRFREVPDRHRRLAGCDLTVEQWDRLQVPVGIVFVFRNSRLDRFVMFYPGAAGATESLLPAEAWSEIVGVAPGAADLTDDVEALLLRRVGGAVEGHVVPIDACYRLIGRMRRVWRGFDGGAQVRDEVDRFFSEIGGREGGYRQEGGRP